MSGSTEVRHHFHETMPYGFSIRMTLDEWQSELNFECFMIVADRATDPVTPIYLAQGHEISLVDYFNSDGEYASQQTDDINQAQVVLSGHFNADGFARMNYHFSMLYFENKEQVLEYEKLAGRINELAREMMPSYFE